MRVYWRNNCPRPIASLSARLNVYDANGQSAIAGYTKIAAENFVVYWAENDSQIVKAGELGKPERCNHPGFATVVGLHWEGQPRLARAVRGTAVPVEAFEDIDVGIVDPDF